MKISVVIPTFNKRELLAETLTALQKQQLSRKDWEIVVVDDGSTDGTGQMLSEISGKSGTQLSVVAPGRNVGRAAARNLGARAAVGDWILFLDDDIMVPPDLLASHLDLLAENSDCGTIGHAVTDPALIDAPHFHYIDTRGVSKLKPGFAPARYFVTQNATVPRRQFVESGGFDERFSAYGFEDMEVAFRLTDDHGVRFLVLPQPEVRHVHHHTLAQYLDKKVECGTSSLGLIARLHPGRIPEMRLNLVIDVPGNPLSKLLLRVFRSFARGWPGTLVLNTVRSWPVAPGLVPRIPALYYRFMDLAVLCCYSRGLSVAENADK